ncbi:MAG: type II secretion system F family protein [bacterium]|nr:type II secretion system F family protein [bacterium]
MTKYYLYLIAIFSLLIILFVVSFYLIRLSIMLNKQKRLIKFSITTNDLDQKTIFEKLEDLYGSIIRKISKVLKRSKIIVKYSKKYDKYIFLDSFYLKEGIDLISNKIIFGIFFVVITVIIDILRLKTVNLFQIIASFLVGYLIINIYVFIKRKKEEKQIQNDLLKAVSIMNNAFKSGRSIMQAVEIVSTELDGAISNEFKKIYLDLSYGLDLNIVFKRFADRVKNDEIKYMSASLTILNKTGGNIVKVFNSIEKGFFDRQKLKDELDSSLALSNMVYKVLVCLPILMILIIYILNPTYFNPLFTTLIGRIIIVISIIIYISYIIIVKKITNLKE